MMATISRYTPARDVSSLQGEMERLVRNALGDRSAATAGAFTPMLDVEESDESFVLHVELPGVNPDDVEVSLEENVLTIAGERNFYDRSEAEGFRRIERHFGRFHRAVRLPDRVDPDRVEAAYRDGMLTISVPKAEESRPRRIQVQAS
ncbi:MAG: Hsp20/alpha crystallin family protein [Nitriliruptoraceae bacterium]